MYLIPLTYLIISTLSTGPVTVLTVHNTTRYGRMAGIFVGLGGTVSVALFAALSLFLSLHLDRLPVVSPDSTTPYEQGGAVFILVMGLWTGYRSLFGAEPATPEHPSNQMGKGFLTGIRAMAPYFPQAIVYYTVILPHYTAPAPLVQMILLMGLFKIVITAGWYSALALAATPIQEWFFTVQIQRFLEFAVSCLLIGISIALFMR